MGHTLALTARLRRAAGPRAAGVCLRATEPEANTDLRAECMPNGDSAARICKTQHGWETWCGCIMDVCCSKFFLQLFLWTCA